MSTATLSPAAGDFGDEPNRIVGKASSDPARPRFVKSRTEVMSVREAIDTSMGRRRYRTRQREA